MLARALAVFVILTAAACAHAHPSWVARGTHTTVHHGQRVVYGVGVVRGVRDLAKARTVAENRARLQIVERLAPRHRGPRFIAATLTNVRITDHWFGRDGAVFALAEYRPQG